MCRQVLMDVSKRARLSRVAFRRSPTSLSATSSPSAARSSASSSRLKDLQGQIRQVWQFEINYGLGEAKFCL